MKAKLGLTDGIAVVVGNIIGAGVFAAPNLVARHVPSDGWMLAAWLFAGLLVLCGVLAVAELGGMMPSNGGFYRYLSEAYGPLTGFLSGWATFLILYSGALAWLCMTFANFLGYFIPLTPLASKGVALALLSLFAIVNIRGLRQGVITQDVLTLLKLGGVLTVIAAAFFAPVHAPVAAVAVSAPSFGLALIGCLLTYDGWVTLSFAAGEMEDPQRNLPRALTIGIGIVIGLYLIANVAYMRVLTPAEIASSERVAVSAVERAIGPAAGGLVAAAALFSIAGTVNGLLLSTPRLYQAMARDGLFFRSLTTPTNAIAAKAAWSALLIVTGTYETLGSFAMLSGYIFYGLTAAAVFVLRRREPDRPRPYRMWGYPVTPALFVLVSLAFILNTLRETPVPAMAGIALILAGVPAYAFWRKQLVEVSHG